MNKAILFLLLIKKLLFTFCKRKESY